MRISLSDAVRVLIGEPRRHRLELGARLLDGAAFGETAVDAQRTRPALFDERAVLVERVDDRFGHQRRPQIGLHDREGAGELRRRDADDGEVGAVELDGVADHRGVGGQVALPEAVRQDDDGVGARGLVFFRQEPTPELGLDAEDREVVARNECPEEHLGVGLAVPAVHHVHLGGEAVECLGLVAVVDVVEIRGHVERVIRGAGEDFDDLVDVGHRQRLEQEAVDHREDGRVHADAERQRQHRHCGKARVGAQLAQGVSHVVLEEAHECSLQLGGAATRQGVGSVGAAARVAQRLQGLAPVPAARGGAAALGQTREK
jgi:hypothetical protein